MNEIDREESARQHEEWVRKIAREEALKVLEERRESMPQVAEVLGASRQIQNSPIDPDQTIELQDHSSTD